MAEKTDEELIWSVQKGNVQEFRFMIERHKVMAYRTAFSITGNHEDAEEVIQDAFLKAFNGLGSFERKSKFSTWLFRIVYYTALNHIEKKNSRKNQLYFADITTRTEGAVEEAGWKKLMNNDQAKYISKAMDQLSAEDRIAMTLFYLEEKSQKEISLLTGWELNATKVRIHRARLKLRLAIDQLLGEEKDSLL